MNEIERPHDDIICEMCNESGFSPTKYSKRAQYDAKTKLGVWAYMCENCFKIHGVGLGLGKGQKFKEDVKSC